MFAIKTRYLGPTDTKGTRIAVSCYGHKTKYYSRDHALTICEQEREVALDYAKTVLQISNAQDLPFTRAGLINAQTCIYCFYQSY